MGLGIIHCGSFLLFAAFALLLVATISAPVIERISFLNIEGQGLRSAFGTFGYCVNANAADSSCSPVAVGYDIPNIAQRLSFDGTWRNNIAEGLTKGLILHPIACGLTFLSILVSLCADRLGYIFAAFLALLAFLASLAVLIIDFVLFTIIRREVNSNTPLRASFGAALWITLAATVILFFSVFFVLFSCCTSRRNERRSDRGDKGYATEGYVGNGHPQMSYAQPPNRRFWQRNRY